MNSRAFPDDWQFSCLGGKKRLNLSAHKSASNLFLSLSYKLTYFKAFWTSSASPGVVGNEGHHQVHVRRRNVQQPLGGGSHAEELRVEDESDEERTSVYTKENNYSMLCQRSKDCQAVTWPPRCWWPASTYKVGMCKGWVLQRDELAQFCYTKKHLRTRALHWPIHGFQMQRIVS